MAGALGIILPVLAGLAGAGAVGSGYVQQNKANEAERAGKFSAATQADPAAAAAGKIKPEDYGLKNPQDLLLGAAVVHGLKTKMLAQQGFMQEAGKLDWAKPESRAQAMALAGKFGIDPQTALNMIAKMGTGQITPYQMGQLGLSAERNKIAQGRADLSAAHDKFMEGQEAARTSIAGMVAKNNLQAHQLDAFQKGMSEIQSAQKNALAAISTAKSAPERAKYRSAYKEFLTNQIKTLGKAGVITPDQAMQMRALGLPENAGEPGWLGAMAEKIL